MPFDSRNSKETPQSSAASRRSHAEIENDLAADAYDEPAPNLPPRSLMGRKFKLYSWLLIALVLGALIAFFLVGLSD